MSFIVKVLGSGSAFIQDADVIREDFVVVPTSCLQGDTILWDTFSKTGIEPKKYTCAPGQAHTVVSNWQSNFLIKTKTGKRVLLDCGGDIRFMLSAGLIDPLSIDAIYISHLHADHVSGVEYMAFLTYFASTINGKKRPQIIAHTKLIDDMWGHSLQGGLDSIQTLDAELSTYFEPVRVKNSGTFVVGGTSFKIIQTVHVVADSTFKPSYGLFIQDVDGNSKKVFITTDTQFAPSQIRHWIQESDVTYHDCETAPFASGVHAHYDELKMLPDDLKSKMKLYHYNHRVENPKHNAISDGFMGFCYPGEESDY